MHTIQPDQAIFLLQFMLPTVEREHEMTRKVIEAIPAGDYRPDPHAKTALEIAWHIVSAEIFFLNGVNAGEFHYGRNDRPPHIKDGADVSRWYSQQFQNLHQALTQLSGEQLTKLIEFRGMVHLPAVFYLQFALNHSIHHRGQLTTYLRPMGSKVPSIYGESYDDRQAREAQTSKA
jgi:uncharacterized damage-inducible protein DinB